MKILKLERHIKFNDHHKLKKTYQPPPRKKLKMYKDLSKVI